MGSMRCILRHVNVCPLAATDSTRHVFVKHGCPRRQQSQTMAKISRSPTF